MLVQKSGDDDSVKSEEEILQCPNCFKTFNCKYDLETHMETHPDTTTQVGSGRCIPVYISNIYTISDWFL